MFSQIARSRSNSTWDVGSRHLLSSWSQFLTLPFQSQVCLSTSKARPEGQLICFIPAFVHLRNRRATMAGYSSDTLSWASRTNEPEGDSHLTLLYSEHFKKCSYVCSYCSLYFWLFFLYQNITTSDSISNLRMNSNLCLKL